jgi:hypothetical protein
MEATEVVGGLWRAFPDLSRVPGTTEDVVPMGFVSRAWRPVELHHSPVDPAGARVRMQDGPAWAGSVPGRGGGPG